MTSTNTRTSSTPFLSFQPVHFSLTDGTDIPPPPPIVETTSQARPAASSSRKQSLIGLGGPLSSHPVTPVDSPAGGFFHDRDMGVGSSQHPPGPIKSSTAYSHASGNSSDSNNFDPALPTHQPTKDRSRRPSLVSRIMRLRSSSFMRSKSSLGRYEDSATTLSKTTTRTSLDGKQEQAATWSERGVKRPASPSLAGPGAGESKTFPRMVRKKSMELLSTARRKSGLWGGGGPGNMYSSAMEDEKERERAREGYNQDLEKPAHERRLQELKSHSPPPTVQLSGLDGADMDGENMFKDIGQ